MDIEIKALKSAVDAEIDILASDKSISHRVCMFGLFADDVCVVRGFLQAEDTLNSLKIASELGLKYEFINESELDSKLIESRSIYKKNSKNLGYKNNKVIESTLRDSLDSKNMESNLGNSKNIESKVIESKTILAKNTKSSKKDSNLQNLEIIESKTLKAKNSKDCKKLDSKISKDSKSLDSKTSQILLLYPPLENALQSPSNVLYCGNSGTSMRLYTGLLAGANIYAILCGDKYLHNRPMGRILKPLNEVGANIFGRVIKSNITQDSKVTESKTILAKNTKSSKKDSNLQNLEIIESKTLKPKNSKNIDSKNNQLQEKILAPLTIIPQKNKLKGFNYHSKISSAQVKSAMILAALQSSEISVYSEITLSRDHTENMLLAFQKAPFLSFIESSDKDLAKNKKDSIKIDLVETQNKKIKISPFSTFKPYNRGEKPLKSFNIEIANDPSSAFFFAILACIIPNSNLTLKRVMLNPTRIEGFKILQKMGANITYKNIKNDYEKSGDITIKHARLRGVSVSSNIAWLIDEIPALSVAMAVAAGKSSVRNARELRVKESDRISVLLAGLRAFGVECVEFDDGFDIIGFDIFKDKNSKNTNNKKCKVMESKGKDSNLQDSVNSKNANFVATKIADSKGDHRIAMSFIILSCLFGGYVRDIECINTSFPNFLQILKTLGVDFLL
ncbi:hypothetical protein DCO58_06880 [Helicobacter saguini]|uniref:3-phosphoshikimate 1-carboxyvinyltransferase n=1 Tax=Helicobacter saguini TaxID=1548018 RepID=A0A6B0HY95_9HELI|nr:hypothetical protein [Helicobacter saguini]MWV67383.1 hypothetical protein [Helicobacter saguini]MWV69736.1 hypothetical protein [Helicobacter saguini]MWV73047.1 hypothetical protein [Helicobacter saguini]